MIFLGTPPERPNPWIEVFKNNPPPCMTIPPAEYPWKQFSVKIQIIHSQPTTPPSTWLFNRLRYGGLLGAIAGPPPAPLYGWRALVAHAMDLMP